MNISDDFAKTYCHLRQTGMLRDVHTSYATARARIQLSLSIKLQLDQPQLAQFQLQMLSALVTTCHTLHVEAMRDLYSIVRAGMGTIKSASEAIGRAITHQDPYEDDCAYIPDFLDPDDDNSVRLNAHIWGKREDEDDQT